MVYQWLGQKKGQTEATAGEQESYLCVFTLTHHLSHLLFVLPGLRALNVLSAVFCYPCESCFVHRVIVTHAQSHVHRARLVFFLKQAGNLEKGDPRPNVSQTALIASAMI